MAVLELKDEKVNVFLFLDDTSNMQEVPIATIVTTQEWGSLDGVGVPQGIVF